MNLNREKTLHIPVGSRCNNNCIFCSEPRFLENVDNKKAFDYFDIIKVSFQKNYTRIVFVNKEPTLSLVKLIKLIKYSKRIGYKDIMILSNGRLLSNEKITDTLIRSGITRIEISLHGSNSKIHDGLTRTPGSFVQTVAGIKNVIKLSKKYNLVYFINFTITQLNYKDVVDFINFIKTLTFVEVNFNYFKPNNSPNSKKQVNLLMPKYSLVINEFLKLRNKNFNLLDIPFCVIPRKLFFTIGMIEKSYIFLNKIFKVDDWKDHKNELNFCKKCKFFNFCPKPSNEYIYKYGDDEFKPIIE